MSIQLLTNNMDNSTLLPWLIDHDRSEISFSINHLLCVVHGKFTRFNISETREGSLADQHFNVCIATDSITTGNSSRDKHLKSAEFFDVANFPFMQFRQGRIIKRTADTILVEGKLFIKDTCIPLQVRGRRQRNRASSASGEGIYYSIEAELSRNACGFSWNGLTSDLQIILGDKISISGEIVLSGACLVAA